MRGSFRGFAMKYSDGWFACVVSFVPGVIQLPAAVDSPATGDVPIPIEDGADNWAVLDD